MENGFLELIEQILSYSQKKVISSNKVNEVYYRGHSNVGYKLLPGLARVSNLPEQKKLNEKKLLEFESRLASGFMQYGNHLISQHKGSWDVLYLMQHHGLPTRLLDWSESLMTALYFAVRDANHCADAAIWVLDPYNLNNTGVKKKDFDVLEYLDVRYPEGYYNYFVDSRMRRSEPFPKRILAIASTNPSQRIINQAGAFTIHNHRDFYKPLDKLYPKAVKKFVLKREYFEFARTFFIQCKMNEFSMFPDLDGLARYIRKNEIY